MADEFDLGSIWTEFQNNGRDCGPVTSCETPHDMHTGCGSKPKPIYGRPAETSPSLVIRACLDNLLASLDATKAWPVMYKNQQSPPMTPAPAVSRGPGGVSGSRGVAVGVNANQCRGGNAMVCSLCRTNGESAEVYTLHSLKDSSGRVTCPVLYAYRCPICGATGARAHTLKYCPLQGPGAVSVVKQLKTTRNSAGHRRQ